MMMPPACAIASTTSTPGMIGIAGKVALEERLVDGHILDGHQALAALELDHSVDQQKRVTVRKEIQDFLDVKCHANLQRAAGVIATRPYRLYRSPRFACQGA